MSALALQSRLISHRPHWVVLVSCDKTSTVQEKFLKVGGRKSNHKPQITKIVAWAKSVWDRLSESWRPHSPECCQDRLGPSHNQEEDGRDRQPAMETVMPSLWRPCHAAHGLLHRPTSEMGTAHPVRWPAIYNAPKADSFP